MDEVEHLQAVLVDLPSLVVVVEEADVVANEMEALPAVFDLDFLEPVFEAPAVDDYLFEQIVGDLMVVG